MLVVTGQTCRFEDRLAVWQIFHSPFLSGLGDRFDDICGKDFGRPAGGDYGDPGERPSAASRDLKSRPYLRGPRFFLLRKTRVPTSADA
jgi:hypothetical protein